MRIRKRHVLFSSPHFPVTPSSDPHLNNRSPVVVQLGDATTTAPEPSSPVLLQQQRGSAVLSLDRHQPSDQPINGWDHPSSGIGESGARRRQHSKQDPSEEDGGVREESGGDSEEKKGNHSRKGRIFGSQTLPPPSPSSIQDGRWCEEEKAIPFKKRRGTFENGAVDNTSHDGNGKKTKTKMKTKMNKKCSSTQNNDEDDEDQKAVHEAKSNVNNNNGGGGGGCKKRARGSALMEGSRCSRVNGRGWRCCQQTLVGYSLCEHHLGKGRLRSMTSVRSRSTSVTASSSSTTTTTAPTNKVVHQDNKPSHDHDDPLSLLSSSPSSSPLEKQTDKCVAESDVNDEKKPVIITKKRMKLGTVKARSMSSLLGQTNTGIAVAQESRNK